MKWKSKVGGKGAVIKISYMLKSYEARIRVVRLNIYVG